MRTNGEYAFMEVLKKSFHQKHFTAFDVGANKGDYSRLLLSCAQKHELRYKLHLFEPLSACFEQLKTCFKEDPSIILNPSGASDLTTELEMYLDPQNSGFASLYKRSLTVGLSDESLLKKRLDSSG